MNKKLLWLAIIALSVMVMGPFVTHALAGGGPGPGGAGPDGCFAYLVNWTDTGYGSTVQLYPGDSIQFDVWANCPVTISNTWDDESAAVTQYDIATGGQPINMSDLPVTFTVPPGTASGDYYIKAN